MKSISDDREMPITAAAIQHVIKNTFVESAEHHQSLASTNDYGITLARNQKKLTANAGHLIYTESQTHGRGRGNNHWLSAPGSLTFSLLVSRPQASATVASLQSAVAIAKACSAYANHAAVRVKWPNDIYLEDFKLGGILIEAPAGTDRWVIGIGINVNNKTKNLEEGGDRQPKDSQCSVVQQRTDRDETVKSEFKSLPHGNIGFVETALKP